MDLINREEVHDIIAMHLSDYMTDETRLKLEMIDCKIEDCIPTVQAVPIEVLDKIRTEIEQIADEEQKHDEKWAIGLRYAVKIIDKYRESEVQQ